VVVEHQRLVEQCLRDVQRAVRIARQEHSFRELGGGPQVDRGPGHLRHDMEHWALPMANRRTTPKELPDAVREAVDRTVQATVGGAQSTRDRTRDTLDELVKAAETQAREVRERVRDAIGELEERRPATQEDVSALRKELRAITRRLDAIEQRLPAKRGGSSSRSTPRKAKSPTRSSKVAAARSAAKRSSGSRGSRSR
jgi:polyhydroxyalkanoate synthesis regulator phasin